MMLVSLETSPAWKRETRETKQETKPFPTGGMAGLLANRTGQGNERETAKGNERELIL
jgi:hypothetical protein